MGLMTATEVSKGNSAPSPTAIECISYSMYVWCTDEMVPDTVCYGPGTGTPTFHDARVCMIKNSQLMTYYSCGNGPGAGQQPPGTTFQP